MWPDYMPGDPERDRKKERNIDPALFLPNKEPKNDAFEQFLNLSWEELNAGGSEQGDETNEQGDKTKKDKKDKKDKKKENAGEGGDYLTLTMPDGTSIEVPKYIGGTVPIAGVGRIVKIVAANDIIVQGFTWHAVRRAIQRGVKPKAILDALKNPLKIGEVVIDDLGRASQRLIGRSAEVVINPNTGRIISVNPTSSSKATKLLKQLEP
jgi:hypothetical protein